MGSAWSFSENYIQRNTNYTINNLSDDEFILVLEGNSYNLIYVNSDGRYHTKVENFLYIDNLSGGNNNNGEYWIVKTREGTQHRFGFYDFSELISNQNGNTSRWSLDLINDTYNNSIFYNYTENPFTNDQGVVYLDSIQYNNDKEKLIFITNQMITLI